MNKDDLRDIDYARLVRDNKQELYTSSYYGAPWEAGTYSYWLGVVPTYTYEVWDEPRICSNLDYVRDALAEFSDDVREESLTLYVRLYRDNDESNGFTQAAMKALELLSRLEDYPLLDEDAYSEIEWEMLERFAGEDVPEMREKFPGVCDACLRCAHIEASRYYGEFWVDLDGKVFRDSLADVWPLGYSGPIMRDGRCIECLGDGDMA